MASSVPVIFIVHQSTFLKLASDSSNEIEILACIDCAKAAGYRQLELNAVAENKAALSLYESAGFVEFDRNPRGFCSRYSGWQELVLMRLELD